MPCTTPPSSRRLASCCPVCSDMGCPTRASSAAKGLSRCGDTCTWTSPAPPRTVAPCAFLWRRTALLEAPAPVRRAPRPAVARVSTPGPHASALRRLRGAQAAPSAPPARSVNRAPARCPAPSRASSAATLVRERTDATAPAARVAAACAELPRWRVRPASGRHVLQLRASGGHPVGTETSKNPSVQSPPLPQSAARLGDVLLVLDASNKLVNAPGRLRRPARGEQQLRAAPSQFIVRDRCIYILNSTDNTIQVLRRDRGSHPQRAGARFPSITFSDIGNVPFGANITVRHGAASRGLWITLYMAT